MGFLVLTWCGERGPVLQEHGLPGPFPRNYVQHMYCGLFMLYPASNVLYLFASTIQQPSSWNASYNQDSSAVHSIRNLPSETNLASKGVFQSSDSRGQDNTHGERQSEVGKHCIIFWYWNRLFKNYVFPIQRYELYY